MAQPNLSLVRELIRNPAFQRWVLTPESGNHLFWESYLEQYPERRAEVALAQDIVQTLGFRVNTADNADFIEVWEQVYQQTHQETPARRISYRGWVAASIVGLLGLMFAYWWLLPLSSQRVYQTGYGETQQILLPDRSRVTLNGNSRLTFADDWSSATADREVQLRGEAYFQVTKQYRQVQGSATPVKFTVQAGEVAVEVLGTTFNVVQQSEQVQVVLVEGKVQLRTDTAPTRMTLEPGDRADYQTSTEQFAKQPVNPRLYTAWQDDRYVFENTSLTEIARLIERTYGPSVVFQEPSLTNRRITATIPSTDLDTLLTVLQETLNLSISRKPNQLILSKQ